MSGLVILAGLLSAWVGVAMAASRVRIARRAYRKIEGLAAATPDGWHGWFLDGFSGLTVGVRWLSALAAWLGWTLAGAWLIGLGIRLLS